jgi:enoyl-CoA hydratase/carnithine racemase
MGTDPISRLEQLADSQGELETIIGELVEASDAFDWDTCDRIDEFTANADAALKRLASTIADQRSNLVKQAGGRLRVGDIVWRVQPKRVQRTNHGLVREAIVREVLADGAESVLSAVREAIGLTFSTYLSDSAKAKQEAVRQLGLDPAEVIEWVGSSSGGVEFVGVVRPVDGSDTMGETKQEGESK